MKLTKALEVHDCKPWVTKLSIVPHTLVILTLNVTYCIILHVLDYVNESHVNRVRSIVKSCATFHYRRIMYKYIV